MSRGRVPRPCYVGRPSASPSLCRGLVEIGLGSRRDGLTQAAARFFQAPPNVLPGPGPLHHGQLTRLMRGPGSVSLLVMGQALAEVRRAITGSPDLSSLPAGLPYWLATTPRSEALRALRRAALLPPA